jgi:TolB protein
VQDLYVQTVNADGTLTRLTTTPEAEFSPSWGGTDIYFLRSTAAGQDQVFRVPASGGASTAITASATTKRGLSVSPDGAFLSFWSSPAGGAPTLVTKRLSDGVENIIFTSTAGADKLFTSWFDGSAILGSHRRPGEGEATVFSIRPNGAEFRSIVSGFQPRRSGSGNRLMFGRTVGALDRIFTSTLSGGDVTQFSGGAGTVDGWDWSRD